MYKIILAGCDMMVSKKEREMKPGSATDLPSPQPHIRRNQCS